MGRIIPSFHAVPSPQVPQAQASTPATRSATLLWLRPGGSTDFSPWKMRFLLAVLVLGSSRIAAAYSVDPYTPRAFPKFSSSYWGPDPAVFSSHMVLQSNDAWSVSDYVLPARVWGLAHPGETITISGLPTGASVLPSNPFVADPAGAWNVTISAPPSRDAVNLTFAGSSTKNVTLSDVLFGATFLCSGQSNMDMDIAMCFYWNETLDAAAQYADIRLLHSVGTGWVSSAASNATLSSFSAVCYYFARALKQVAPAAFADVPIGLVQGSVGGTAIETWMSEAALTAAGVPAANATPGAATCSGQVVSANYNALIAPVAPFAFRGLLWYQGETNVACNAETSPPWRTDYYSRLLPSLIHSWRGLFASPMAALVALLAPYDSTDQTPAERSGDALPLLRSDQLSGAAQEPDTAVMVALDLGDDGTSVYTPPSPRHGGIHPRNKTEFGRRLALLYAEAEGVLPPGVLAAGPRVPVASAAPGGLVLTYPDPAGTGSGLALAPTTDCRTTARIPAPANATPAVCCQTAAGTPASWPFELRLSDNATYVLAAATVGTGTAAGTVSLVPNGTAVTGPFTGARYSWQGYPLCVLMNAQGLPGEPFELSVGA